MIAQLHDQRPESVNDHLIAMRKSEVEHLRQRVPEWDEHTIFAGKAGEMAVLYGQNNQRTFLLGFGEEKQKKALLNHVIRWMLTYRKHLKEGLAVTCQDKSLCELLVQGITMGTYTIPQRNKPDKADPMALQRLHIVDPDPEGAFGQRLREVIEVAQTQKEVMDLVNKPSNELTPEAMGAWTKSSGERFGYEVEVWDKKKIEDEGLHGLLSVSQGSVRPPVFIRAHYRPEGLPKDALRLGLIGKGVTFDTGGVSLKPSENMHYMKSDMGGASVMLGTMEAIARLRLPLEVELLVCSCENAIGSHAIKPGDVIDSYSGKTIEVLNTDAEGRLILADGLNYSARHFKPHVMLNAATLTGSCVRTLGYDISGMFTTNDELATALEQAADSSGEEVWRLPLLEAHGKLLKSDVADIKNFGNSPLAGASLAAKFLEFFTESHPNWAHLDVAGTVFGDTPFSKEKNATGYGVLLLVRLVEQLLANPDTWKTHTV